MLKSIKGSESHGTVVPRLLDNWLRTSECSIEGQHIVARGRVVWYSPASARNLTGEFGDVMDATGAIRFVTEYGPLELPEGVSRISLAVGATAFEWRESVQSILVRAKKVARIRKAAALFTDIRENVQKHLASTLVDLWSLKMPLSSEPKTFAKHLSAAQAKHSVGEFILQELNEHLPRSSERAHINVRGEFESVLTFESLLAVIYRRLFEELERGKLRLCHQCGAVFEWTDPRQMYCGKRCGLNLAQQRYRERQTGQRHG
jgi:hypothetical protein